MFDAPTVAALAAQVDAARTASAAPRARPAIGRTERRRMTRTEDGGLA
jgi:hypothetical protein